MKKEKSLSIAIKIFTMIAALFIAGASALQAQDTHQHHSHKKQKEMKTSNVHSDTSAVSESECHTDNAMGMHKSCCSKEEENVSSSSAEENSIWNQVCPVLGNKVDPDVEPVEYNDKLYGFCCAGCDEKFKADPLKYSKRLSEDGKSIVRK